MKKYFIYLVLFFPAIAAAQTVSLTEEIQLRNEISYDVIGEFRGNTLLFRNRNNEVEVQAFNEGMKEVWSKELKLDRRNSEILGVAGQNDYFVLIYRYRQKGEHIVKAHKYDPGANLIDSTVVKNYGNRFITPDFETVISEDKTKFLLYYFEKADEINALVFDAATMKATWQRMFELEDYSQNRDELYFLTNNQGHFVFVIEKDNAFIRKENHHFQVYIYDGEVSDEYKKYLIPMPNVLNFDIELRYDDMNDALVAIGFYAKKNIQRALGYFSLFIPRDLDKQYSMTIKKFEDEFISNLMGKDIEDNRGLMDCSIQNMVLRSDGGVLLIAEMNRQFERRLAGTGRVMMDNYNRFIVDYYYDDVFVMSINPNGKIHWTEILYKKQYSQDDNAIFSSFFLFRTPNALRFLFNDEIKPENTVSEYVVAATGNVDRRSILNTQNLKLRLRFRDAVQVDFDEVVVPSERRNRLRLVKIEY